MSRRPPSDRSHALLVEAREALIKNAATLIDQLSQYTDLTDYRRAVVRYVCDSLYVGNLRRWFDSIQWIYAGLHISTDILIDYVSSVFSPQQGVPDIRGSDYLGDDGGSFPYTFTTFLWPAQVRWRESLRAPLEIQFEESRSLLTEADRKEIQSQVCITVDRYGRKFERLCQTDPGPFPRGHPAIVITASVRRLLQENALDRIRTIAWDDPEVHICLLQAYHFLYRTYLHDAALGYGVSPEQCLEAIARTIHLHAKVEIEPGTVLFVPVMQPGQRLGVFCFVTKKHLTMDQRALLCEIGHDAVSNMRAIDQMAGERRDFLSYLGLRSASLVLHEVRNRLIEASGALDTAKSKLGAGPKGVEEGLSLIARADGYHKTISDQLGRLENLTFSLNLGSSTMTAEDLRVSLVELLGPKISAVKLELLASDTAVEIEGTARHLAEALFPILDGCIRGAEEVAKAKGSDPEAVVVRIQCAKNPRAAGTTQEAIIRIILTDKGGGLGRQVLAEYRSKSFDHKLSSKRPGGGLGLVSALKVIRRLYRGEYPSRMTGPGTEWLIEIPCRHAKTRAQQATGG